MKNWAFLAIQKPQINPLVAGWVTTSEFLKWHVFFCFSISPFLLFLLSMQCCKEYRLLGKDNRNRVGLKYRGWWQGANLNTCLRGTSLIWYTAELTELEKMAFRQLNGQWIERLQKKFKPNQAAAFTIADVRNKEPSAYNQTMISNAKDANFESTN